MKDPAFMFYSQDFLVGTLAMSFDDRGRYITLMCYQHQTGHISEETIRLLVGSFSDNLKCKFIQDENGLFYNDRLEDEIEKRQKFTESRRNNGILGGRPKKENKPSAKPNGKPNGKPRNNLHEDENNNIIPVNLSNSLFIEKWKILINEPKWKKKSISAIEQSLNKLSRYDVYFAIELIEESIANDTQGVVYPNTDERYKKWLSFQNTNFDKMTDDEKEKYKQKIWSDCFSSERWIKSNSVYLKTDDDNVKILLKEFLTKIIADGTILRTLSEIQSHFTNWAKKKI